MTQNCIVEPTDAPIKKQYQALEDKHARFVEGAAAAGCNVLCFQEAWTMPFAFCTREKLPWSEFAECAQTGTHVWVRGGGSLTCEQIHQHTSTHKQTHTHTQTLMRLRVFVHVFRPICKGLPKVGSAAQHGDCFIYSREGRRARWNTVEHCGGHR